MKSTFVLIGFLGGLASTCADIPPAPGGRGNFQSVKLQRPDRVAVCSHSAGDTTAHVKPILHLMPAEPRLATNHEPRIITGQTLTTNH